MKIFVLGAGVASLAFTSFFKEDRVNVIEKNSFAGRKLLATGNGRCNFSNLNLSYDNYLSENPDFVKYALDNFSNVDLFKHFEAMGIEWTNLESGRVYPKTMSSKTVRDGLFLEAREHTNFIFDKEILDIDFDKKLLISEKTKYKYDILVIASGGSTLKNSGSDGKVWELLKNKTKLIPMTPAITNYEAANPLSKKAKGTKVKAKVSLFVDGKKIRESTDDVIFQTYGLTGTAILDLSNHISQGLKNKKDLRIDIDFYPEYSYNILLGKLLAKAKKYPRRNIEELLLGFLHENLIGDICKRSGIGKIKDKNQALKKLASNLKATSFKFTNIHDKTNAQVSLGGVSTSRIDPRTMRSLDIKDTYFIGEVMDVAGDCGGYNIQWAFSSAKCACDDIRRLYVKNK